VRLPFRRKTKMAKTYTAFSRKGAQRAWVRDALRLEKDGWVSATEQHAHRRLRYSITVVYARR
jgi:hypothetical protein